MNPSLMRLNSLANLFPHSGGHAEFSEILYEISKTSTQSSPTYRRIYLLLWSIESGIESGERQYMDHFGVECESRLRSMIASFLYTSLSRMLKLYMPSWIPELLSLDQTERNERCLFRLISQLQELAGGVKRSNWESATRR